MAFEDQITQAFDTLTERLRGEIDQEVVRRIAAMPPLHAPVAPVAPVAAAADASSDGTSARLSDAVRAIDEARTLTGVLDALLSAARAEAPGAEIWLLRGGQRHRWHAGAADADAPPMDAGIPLMIAGESIGVVTTAPSDAGTHNVELLTRYAGKALEALTAFKTARALTQQPEPAPVPPGVDLEEDTSARRYARLLVSEIKLYHEAAVIDGRRDRDLATRLGGEIARARVLYEQRVPPHVRDRADYFRDELVRTLANGDASLLQLT